MENILSFYSLYNTFNRKYYITTDKFCNSYLVFIPKINKLSNKFSIDKNYTHIPCICTCKDMYNSVKWEQYKYLYLSPILNNNSLKIGGIFYKLKKNLIKRPSSIADNFFLNEQSQYYDYQDLNYGRIYMNLLKIYDDNKNQSILNYTNNDITLIQNISFYNIKNDKHKLIGLSLIPSINEGDN